MNDHTDTAAPISLDVQVACIRREIGMRERVYPRWVATEKMKPQKADDEIAAMRAVLATLQELKAKERLL